MAHLHAREVADHANALRQHFLERSEPLLGQRFDFPHLLRQLCVFHDHVKVVLQSAVEERLDVVSVCLAPQSFDDRVQE